MKKITLFVLVVFALLATVNAQVEISEGTGYYEFNDETDIWKNTATGIGEGTVMCEGVFKFDPDATDTNLDDMESEELTDYMIVDGMAGKAISLKAHNWLKIWHGIAANGGSEEWVNDFTVVMDVKVMDADGVYSLLEVNPTPSENGYTSELEIVDLQVGSIGAPASDAEALGFSVYALEVDKFYRISYVARLSEFIKVFVNGELWISIEGDFSNARPAPYSANAYPADAAIRVGGNNETYPANDPARDGDKIIDMVAVFDYDLSEEEIASFGAPVSNKLAKASDLFFEVYPNPASNSLLVNGQGEVVLTNVMGQVVIQGKAGAVMDVSGLVKGIYMVSLVNNGSAVSKKICIE